MCTGSIEGPKVESLYGMLGSSPCLLSIQELEEHVLLHPHALHRDCFLYSTLKTLAYTFHSEGWRRRELNKDSNGTPAQLGTPMRDGVVKSHNQASSGWYGLIGWVELGERPVTT